MKILKSILEIIIMIPLSLIVIFITAVVDSKKDKMMKGMIDYDLRDLW